MTRRPSPHASILLIAVLIGGCAPGPASPPPPLVTDAARCEVRLSGTVQRTGAPRMDGFAAAIPALLGSRGGAFESHFVFLVQAPVREVHDALLRLGARSRVVYKLADVAAHRGLRAGGTPDDYLQGDPVQIFVDWRDGGRTLRRAYEDFFQEQIAVNGSKAIKPWTPHFVFHGSGVLNGRKTGCIACTHDCPGGIIGNNQYPLEEPRPVLRADWKALPPPGTPVTVVLRPVPSAKGDEH